MADSPTEPDEAQNEDSTSGQETFLGLSYIQLFAMTVIFLFVGAVADVHGILSEGSSDVVEGVVPQGIDRPTPLDSDGAPQNEQDLLEVDGPGITTTIANPTKTELGCTLTFTGGSGVVDEDRITVPPQRTATSSSHLGGPGSFVRNVVCGPASAASTAEPARLVHAQEILVSSDSLGED